MILAALLAVAFVELHGPSGQVLEINPALVSSIRQPLDVAGPRHWAHGTRCVIVMSNGMFLAVSEDCPTAIKLLGQ
jgi:hypothetical protein